MATKISESTSSTAEATDLVPIAKIGDATARRVTADALVKAVQASTSARGSVELATTAETQAGTDDERAVTPEGLAAYFDQTVLCGDSFKLKVPGQTRAEFFQLYVAEGLFDGVYDPVAYWGFNVNGVGGRVDSDLPAIWMQFEADYYVGGRHVQEWNFNCFDEDDNQLRYMAFVSDRDDYTRSYWAYWIGNTGSSFFNVSDIETNAELFKVDGTNAENKSLQNTVVLGQLEVGTAGVISAADNQVAISGTKTPGSDYYSLKISQTVNPSDTIDVSALLNQLTITTPDSVAFNTIRGAYFYTPNITLGDSGSLSYAYSVYIDAAPTEATNGNWALYTAGRAGFESGANFGCANYDDEVTDPVDIVTGTLRQRAAKTPSSAGDTGRTGQICWDTSYIYICVGTNTWKRAEISTWA